MKGNIPPRGGIPRKRKVEESSLSKLNRAFSGVVQEIPSWARESDSQNGIAGVLENLLGEAGLPKVIDTLLRGWDGQGHS